MSSKKLPLLGCNQWIFLLPIGMEKHNLSPIARQIIDKILSELRKHYEKSNLPYYKIADKCQTSEKHICNLINGKLGNKFTLDMALKIWTGLGHPPETLIADCNVDPLLAERIKRIQAGEWKEFFDLVVNVLGDAEYVDPVELGEIKGDLKNLWRRIVKLKEHPPGNPGEKLSNSSKD